MIRTYTELCKLTTFKDRFEYLKIGGKVGDETFGFERYLNQRFYRNDKRWHSVRDMVILRDTVGDYCCDLGVSGYDIYGTILIHHMNPITKEDLIYGSDYLLNPEYLIATSLKTHNAIHYGDSSLMIDYDPIIRFKNDTCPWKK